MVRKGELPWKDERGGYSFIEGRENGTVSARQLRQMAVGGLPARLCPHRKPGDIMIVGDELERDRSLLL